MPQDGHGWTLLAVAAVNRTGTRQKGKEITMVERNGQSMIRIPILKKAAVRYKGQVLRFGQDEFDIILRNHRNEVWDSAPYLRESHEGGDVRKPAMGWLDKDAGGEVVQEGDMLVGYCPPTDETAIATVKSRKFRYASADLHPNYLSAQITPLEGVVSTINFEDLSEAELVRLEETETQEETTMPEETKDMVPKADLDKLATEKSELEKRVQDLEAKIKELTPEPELELPAAAKEQIAKLEAQVQAQATALEAQRARLELEAKEAKVNALVAQWKTPKNGKIHPAYIIETAKSILMFEPIGEGEDVIKFEADAANGTADYLFKAVEKFINGLPRTLAFEGQTVVTGENPLDSTVTEFGMDSKTLEDHRKEQAKKQYATVNGNGRQEEDK